MGVNGEDTLPDGWEVLSLGAIVESQYGTSAPSCDDGNVASIGMKNIVDGRLVLANVVSAKLNDTEIAEYDLRPGDILFNRTNSFDLVGKTAVFEGGPRGRYVFASYLVRLTVDRRRADPRFVCYAMQTAEAEKRLKSLATVGVSQCNINPSALKRDFRLRLPPLTQQREIVRVLSAWSKAEEHSTALIDAKRRLRAALHHQMLTRSRGVTDSHPSPWPRRLMSDIVERVRRPVEVQPDTEYREIGIRSHGKGVFHKDPVLGEELGDKAVFWVQPDCLTFNVVFAWEQAVAVTSSAEAGMIASHRFPMYKPKPGLLSLRYALLYLLSKDGKSALELGSPGGAGRNRTLSQEAFNKIAIPLPPFEEQERIADVLSAMDGEVALLRQYLDALKKQKRGIMQLLLTGKIRVRP